MTLSGIGVTATAQTSLTNGGIQKIDIIDGGYGYKSTPTIIIEDPVSGTQAQAIGIMTEKRSLLLKKSLKEIYLTNPGSGYTSTDLPSISFFGGGGHQIKVVPTISDYGNIGIVTITSPGSGYTSAPIVTFSSPPAVSAPSAIVETTVEDNFSYPGSFDSNNNTFDQSNLTFDSGY